MQGLGSISPLAVVRLADEKERTRRAGVPFLKMKDIWASRNLTINTKITLFNITIKPVLLYGAETWRSTVATLKKTQTFINTCLRKILRIRWPEAISNRELGKRTKQQPAQKRGLWLPEGQSMRRSTPCLARPPPTLILTLWRIPLCDVLNYLEEVGLKATASSERRGGWGEGGV